MKRFHKTNEIVTSARKFKTRKRIIDSEGMLWEKWRSIKYWWKDNLN